MTGTLPAPTPHSALGDHEADLRSVYTASTTLMLDTRKTQVVDFESVVSGLNVDEAVVQSEVAILKSRKLAYRVVEALELRKDPEFNPQIAERLRRGEDSGPTAVGRLLERIGIADASSKPEDPEYPTTKVVTNVLNRFKVQNDGKSYAISLFFTSLDPEKAAKIVNTWADQYLVDQLEVKFEATERANEWLSKRLAEMKEKVTIADNAVVAAREKYNIVETEEGQTLTTRQLTEINTQLVLAQTERAQAEARLRRARELARSNTSLDAVGEVIASPLIQKLREQEAEVLRREAELGTRYGERHPAMINIRAEVRDIDLKIREEVNRIISSLENEVEVARVRENTLRQKLNEIEGQQTFVNRAQIQISQLEREASANRMLYESFLNRFKQIYEQDDMQQSDARIIARADVPERPSKPLRALILGAAMFASLLMGMFIVFLMEMLHNTFRTSMDVEKFTGLKSLAMVPKLPRNDSKNLVGYIRSNLTSAYCESVRSVLTALQFTGSGGKPVQTIVITSSCPGEGKSFFSLSLANIAAMGGKKVLMIDCDFRRPVIAGMLRVQAEQGLSDYLTGQARIEDVIYHDKSTGVDYCFAVHRSQVPQSLLATPEMDTFLRIAREQYDYIIIDTPPVVAVSDVIVLSPHADHVLYAVRYEKTPRRLVRTALRSFQHSIKTPTSMVMTQVDISRHATYGYGDEGYYYGKYGSYYAPQTAS
jgi:succinoglycan biosynthesis transport protein ExoP